ncbi:MAG: amino acid adenylation domain-containing protein, partial [Bacteroidota bacterium]
FDHILVFENYPTNPHLDGLSEDTSQPAEEGFLQLIEEHVFSQNHYPFYIIVGTSPRLKFSVYYNKDQYSLSQVQRMCEHWLHLMEQAIEAPAKKVDQLTLVSKTSEEHEALLSAYNDTTVDFPTDQTVKSVFEKIALDNADQLAIKTPSVSYTYKAVNELSNQLSAYFSKEGGITSSNNLIGILCERSDYTILAMLASLKTGSVFVPIHVDLPATNIQNILEETQVTLLCVESHLLEKVSTHTGALFAMDIQLEMLEESTENLSIDLSSSAPLYTIYSSGTTGKPKGVVISHQSLLNYAQWLIQQFDLSAADKGALLSSPAFDLGYTTIWGCLLSGASLYLPEQKWILAPDRLLDYLIEAGISFLKLTPSHFKALLAVSDPEKITALDVRLLLLGGEKIQVRDIATFLKYQNKTHFVNHYGPTETTIGTLTHQIDTSALAEYEQIPLIGQPIANQHAYILDQNQQVLPIGAIGDLYIGGPGLAIEYLHQAKLTEEKFVQSAWGERLYCTGDKARRYPDGSIVFLGRKDQEVKIRGYRINLTEIETVIKQQTDLSFASVQAFENGEGEVWLCAYVKEAELDSTEQLAQALKDHLPDYMLPRDWISIEQIPLTANGKLDVKALRTQQSDVTPRQIIAPETPTEQKLVKIWQRVLEKEAISTDDDFFELGGHSLKAVQIISRIIVDFKINLAVKDVFDNTTIQALAHLVDQQLSWQGTDESIEEIVI